MGLAPLALGTTAARGWNGFDAQNTRTRACSARRFDSGQLHLSTTHTGEYVAHPLGDGTPPTTAYGIKGTHWRACGFHTGADWARNHGTPVYAVEDGNVRYRSYGSAFGLQLAVSPDKPGEWFYAHLSWRAPNGARVKAGDLIGRVGNTGNSTGPHLHLEYHTVKQRWVCSEMRDPWKIIQSMGGSSGGGSSYPTPTSNTVYLSKLKYGQQDSDSVWYLQRALGMDESDWVGDYGPKTDAAVRSCQAKHVPPADPEGKSFVGPTQAAHLFDGSGIRVVDDRPKDDPDPAPPAWWLSKAAAQLRDEVDALWPDRDKRTDGTIGDLNHTTGEHVPNDKGEVRAIDIDADLDTDPDTSWQLADLLRAIAKTDGRIYYIIHDGKITSGTYQDTFWTWRDYDGANPHTSHLHVSFFDAKDGAQFDLATRWSAMYEQTDPEPQPPEAGGWRRLFYDAGARGSDLDTAVAVTAAESNGYADAVGDLTLINDKWGPSVGGTQIRTLRDPAGYAPVDAYRDIEKLRDPAYQVEATLAIAQAGGWGLWSTFKHGTHEQFMAPGFDLPVRTGHGRSGCWSLDGCPDTEPEAPVTRDEYNQLVARVDALEKATQDALADLTAKHLTHTHGKPQ